MQLLRVVAYDERDWQANAEDVNDQLGEKGFSRKRAFWCGGKRNDDAAHH